MTLLEAVGAIIVGILLVYFYSVFFGNLINYVGW